MTQSAYLNSSNSDAELIQLLLDDRKFSSLEDTTTPKTLRTCKAFSELVFLSFYNGAHYPKL